MKERSITLREFELQALKDGCKTQLRRVVDPQPPLACGEWGGWIVESFDKKDVGKASWHDSSSSQVKSSHRVRCPYGVVGDRLWVRESWRVATWSPNQLSVQYRDGVELGCEETDENSERLFTLFEESSDDCERAKTPLDGDMYDCSDGLPTRWRSPITMAKWASRTWLEVTGLRVQRLEDISEEDARAEGYPVVPSVKTLTESGMRSMKPRSWFFEQWSRSCGYKAPHGVNPWVWVVEFKLI